MTHAFIKHGVRHVFHDMGGDIGQWLIDNFQTWEEHTFNVFEQVKSPNATALDIGAWIGTTAIWLAHNFANVVAVEPDPVSADFLKRNLVASGCTNVIICDRPISNVERDVVFGPRGHELNQSTSYIKAMQDNPNDVTIRTVTFDNLPIPEGANVTFVKCDIEGGEESILEDLLEFCIKNKSHAWVSFHLSWWKDQDIKRFFNLFSKFNTDVPDPISRLIHQDGFGSILFQPKGD